ncbi:MAG: hypothetical protein RMZ43_001990 [Nostoc sp. CmiVER01]|uniref:hypothetical protein n=1 Tax=Nostoc sp. CmiVER01 TaxID=3075384 RepID=UPI002AD33CCC|nr:hypothetical protein [Nostoc sp. CmiVER01]MDZ8126116.1 hypothetical protein [Nostoc sp. CmiVER01]
MIHHQREYRYVVIASDATALYDTQTELGNPWLLVLGKTSTPVGWGVSHWCQV